MPYNIQYTNYIQSCSGQDHISPLIPNQPEALAKLPQEGSTNVRYAVDSWNWISTQHWKIRSFNIALVVTSNCPVNLEHQVHFLMNLPPLPSHICVSEYLFQNLLHVNGMPMCVRHDKLCTYTLILSAIAIRLMHVMSNHKGADGNKDYVEDYDCIGGHVDEYDDGNYMVGEDDRGPGGIARISALLGLMQLHCKV